MKKLIISFLFLFILTGCYNYHELNNYSIVTGISIDKSNDGYEVSVLIANTPKNDTNKISNSSKVVVYSGYGKSIFEAIKDIGLISPKELYLGHFSLLVISEDVAKVGINSVVDLFLRESSSKKNFLLAVSKDCRAKDTLKIITPLSNSPSQSISDNLSSTTKLQGIIANTDFNELLYKLKNVGVDNAINSIVIIGNVNEGSSKENVENSEPDTYIKLSTLGLFKGDKLVYWTNKEESIGINILRNKTKETYISINYDDTNIIIDTNSLKSNITTILENKKPKIKISVKGEAKLVEISGHVDISNSQVIKSINQLLNQEIIDYVSKGIGASIKNNVDVLGFGLKFYQEYPNYYKNIKNWYNEIKNIDIDIECNVELKTKGTSQISLEDNDDK